MITGSVLIGWSWRPIIRLLVWPALPARRCCRRSSRFTRVTRSAPASLRKQFQKRCSGPLGTISAMMALDWFMGRKNPWSELFAVDRKKIKGATWNYLRENKDYPYYMIKDRIARPESDSVRKLERGRGMIVGSRAKKIAAFRHRNGKLHKLSPVCPHLGCHVRWNSAESTWDCPCHGSRFKPNGEVIAGPAEEALSAG